MGSSSGSSLIHALNFSGAVPTTVSPTSSGNIITGKESLRLTKKDKDKEKKLSVGLPSTFTAPNAQAPGDSLFEVLKSQPVHQSEAVREASEVFLLSMLNFYANFPTLAGCEQITAKDELEEVAPGSSSPSVNLASQGSGTVVDDDGDDDGLYFIYNSSSVFSFDHFDRNGGELLQQSTTRA